MNRTHKIRMYPTREQEVQLRKTAGTSRYVYNWALSTWKQMYERFDNGESTEKPSVSVLARKWTAERPEWATETNRGSQTRAIMNVGIAFNSLWRGKSMYPRFHKKGRKDTFYVDNAHAYLEDGSVHLPQIGKVRLAEKLRYSGKIMSYTVSTYAGQWHVSVQVELSGPDQSGSVPRSVVGVDVGLKHAAVASDGSVLDLPEVISRLQERLKRAQRKLSRKQKKSNNRSKQLLRKQRVQNKINNIRRDAANKFTSRLAKSHGTVVTESLDIIGMMGRADKGLRRNLTWSLMSEIIRQLSYKAKRHVQVDRFYPSTKTCSSCGHVKENMPLSDRTYRCGQCGLVIDRDMNAALNLMHAGAVSPEAPVEKLEFQFP